MALLGYFSIPTLCSNHGQTPSYPCTGLPHDHRPRTKEMLAHTEWKVMPFHRYGSVRAQITSWHRVRLLLFFFPIRNTKGKPQQMKCPDYAAPSTKKRTKKTEHSVITTSAGI